MFERESLSEILATYDHHIDGSRKVVDFTWKLLPGGVFSVIFPSWTTPSLHQKERFYVSYYRGLSELREKLGVFCDALDASQISENDLLDGNIDRIFSPPTKAVGGFFVVEGVLHEIDRFRRKANRSLCEFEEDVDLFILLMWALDASICPKEPAVFLDHFGYPYPKGFSSWKSRKILSAAYVDLPTRPGVGLLIHDSEGGVHFVAK